MSKSSGQRKKAAKRTPVRRKKKRPSRRPCAPEEKADAAAPDTDPLAQLLPEHRTLIDASAIAPEVATERGYRTVTKKVELRDLGFASSQHKVPSLLLPIWGVSGNQPVSYQIRPNEPRIAKGKALKYETPKGTRICLDVPRAAREGLGNPGVPLFITEGARKADAGVSVGLCTIALLGVWNWRGSNEWGGKAALPDWESVALNERKVYLVFDSDVMEKPPVHLALSRLKGFLESRQAQVFIIYLPPGEGGEKVGLDDYLAAGHGVDDLLARATEKLRELPENDPFSAFPYEETAGGLVWHKPSGEGTVPVRLTNFTARVIADVSEDDGLEVRRALEIEAALGERTATFTIPASSFSSMNWAIAELGPRAILSPGFGARDHARAAIQHLSTDLVSRTVYRHTGWRKIDGIGWCYLHAGGALGPEGPVPNTVVDLPGALAGYVLPAPGEANADVFELLDLGPDRIVYPVVAAVWRAALASADFSFHLAGTSGVFKTELAALAQQHWGAALDARNLPASWSSTGNSLEVQAFYAKDAVLVVDDFAPTGSSYDIQRAHKEADRILRAQGNRSGRGRLRSDATIAPTRCPRGLIISTGEDVPGGHSLRARTFMIEISPGDIDQAVLTRCQELAAGGAFARTMAAFLQWAARRFDGLPERMRERAVELRNTAVSEGHARTPSIVGELQAGFEVFLAFGVSTGLTGKDRAEDLRRRCWGALLEASTAQAGHLQTAEPTGVFARLLQAALAAGRAHISNPEGDVPPHGIAIAVGWRVVQIGSGEYQRDEWRPQGDRVGWIDGSHVYLQADAAHRVAQSMASETERLAIGARTLAKRLSEKGQLVTEDAARGKHLVRKSLEGTRRSVLHVLPTLVGLGALRAQQAHEPVEGSGKAGRGPIPGARNDQAEECPGPASGPRTPDDAPDRVASGPGGPEGPETGGQAVTESVGDEWGEL